MSKYRGAVILKSQTKKLTVRSKTQISYQLRVNTDSSIRSWSCESKPLIGKRARRCTPKNPSMSKRTGCGSFNMRAHGSWLAPLTKRRNWGQIAQNKRPELRFSKQEWLKREIGTGWFEKRGYGEPDIEDGMTDALDAAGRNELGNWSGWLIGERLVSTKEVSLIDCRHKLANQKPLKLVRFISLRPPASDVVMLD